MLNINKIKCTDDCDKIIITLLQQSFKKYIEGKFSEAKKCLSGVNKIMQRSKILQLQETRNKHNNHIFKVRKDKKTVKEENISDEQSSDGKHFKEIPDGNQ